MRIQRRPRDHLGKPSADMFDLIDEYHVERIENYIERRDQGDSEDYEPPANLEKSTTL
ncbi:hypothetical protein ACFL0X_00590 [Nanoarchaeota archaeon]